MAVRTAPRASRPNWRGLRRVDFVKIVIDDDGGHAEVHGVRHRLPVVVRASLAAAGKLVAAGVPSVVRREHS